MPCDVDDAHLYDAEMRTHILPRDLERGKGSQRERGMMVSAAVASAGPLAGPTARVTVAAR